MIVMKTVLGPSGYAATGFTRIIGEVEEIEVSSGKLVVAQVVSSADVYCRPNTVSGNIVTLMLEGPLTNSGLMNWASASSVFTTVEIAVIAGGY